MERSRIRRRVEGSALTKCSYDPEWKNLHEPSTLLDFPSRENAPMEPLWRFRGSEIPSSGTPTQFIVKWEDPSMEISDEPLIHDQFEFRHADTPVAPRLLGGADSHRWRLSSPQQPSAVDDGRRAGWVGAHRAARGERDARRTVRGVRGCARSRARVVPRGRARGAFLGVRAGAEVRRAV